MTSSLLSRRIVGIFKMKISRRMSLLIVQAEGRFQVSNQLQRSDFHPTWTKFSPFLHSPLLQRYLSPKLPDSSTLPQRRQRCSHRVHSQIRWMIPCRARPVVMSLHSSSLPSHFELSHPSLYRLPPYSPCLANIQLLLVGPSTLALQPPGQSKINCLRSQFRDLLVPVLVLVSNQAHCLPRLHLACLHIGLHSPVP